MQTAKSPLVRLILIPSGIVNSSTATAALFGNPITAQYSPLRP